MSATSLTEGGAFASTWHDLREGWKGRDLWFLLAKREMQSRYRRSRLGSLWLFANMLIVASVLGSLYSQVLHEPARTFIPYLVAGFTCWNLVSALVLDGCNVFVNNASAIREIPAPLTIYVFKSVCRNFLIFAHNALILALVLLVFRIHVSATTFLVLPGIALVAISGMAVNMLLGVVNVRNRDVGHFLVQIVRLMFLVTPIIWHADKVPSRAAFVMWNPFYYMVEVVRGPLLDQPPPLSLWIGAMLITCTLSAAAIYFYTKYRAKIPLLV